MSWHDRLVWVRNRAMELLVAMAFVYVITAGLEQRDAVRKANVPADAWFEVHEIYVPNHVAGSDPMILYDRTIRENFTGFWVVEAQRRDSQGRFSNVCSGSGVDDYTPEDFLPEEGVRWTWFFGRACAIPPGTYRIAAVWDMRRPDYPLKRQRARSNLFEVLPAGETE